MGDKHLFVLIHGLWGNHKHMKSLEKVLDKALNGKKDGEKKDYLFFLPKQNAMFKTFDGIEIIGYRTLIEICTYLKEFKNGKITKISFIGYSLGGLISRFIVGKMYSECEEIFENIEPCIFMTVATPHLGIQFYNPKKYLHRSILFGTFTALGSTILGKSGRELFITNESNDILVRLSEGEYIKALKKFKHRIAFTNVRNDRTVAFFTGLITDIDPFANSDNRLKFEYLEKVPGKNYSRTIPRIIDMNRLNPDVYIPNERKNPVRYWFRTFSLIFVAVFLVVPIAFFMNVGGSIYSYTATWKYRRMLKNNEFPKLVKEKVGITDDIKNYVSDAYGSIMGSVMEDDNDNPQNFEETPQPQGDDAEEWRLFTEKYSSLDEPSQPWRSKFHKINLTNERLLIMKNLQKLTWVKVPIYVKSANSHGGIIARMGLNDKTPSTGVASLEFMSQLLNYLVNEP